MELQHAAQERWCLIIFSCCQAFGVGTRCSHLMALFYHREGWKCIYLLQP